MLRLADLAVLLCPDALRRAVTLFGLRGRTVDFHQHGVVNLIERRGQTGCFFPGAARPFPPGSPQPCEGFLSAAVASYAPPAAPHPCGPATKVGSLPCSSGVGSRLGFAPLAMSMIDLASWLGSRGRLG